MEFWPYLYPYLEHVKLALLWGSLFSSKTKQLLFPGFMSLDMMPKAMTY